MQEAVDFILEHYPISKTWEPRAVPDWLHWAASKKCLFIARDDDGKIIGLTIVRPLANVDDGTMSDDAFDADGDILFIDLAIAPTKAIGQLLTFGVISTFGQRKTVAFRHSNGKIKKHSFDKARMALVKHKSKYGPTLST